MAKCVQLVGQGVPIRVPNDVAFHIVHHEGDGQYCPKSLWRKFYDTAYWRERGGDTNKHRQR